MEKPTDTAAKSLKLRRRIKKSKPSFARPESWRYIRLKESWRRPRGLDHKMRRAIKGWPAEVGVGYRGPKITRGLHPSGYREVIIHRVEDLTDVDPKTQVARLGHTVGKRKRARIIAEARRKRIVLLNLKEIKEVVKKETLPAEQKEAKMAEEAVEEQERPEVKEEKPKRTKGAKKQ